MFEPSRLYLFIGAALVLLLVPGPAVLYIVARSINQGRLAGLASVLGIEVASLLHVTAATLGLSAILVSSAAAYNLVKLLGAGYLIYLGLRKLLGPESGSENNQDQPESLLKIFSQGVIVNLLNPKTALFFFAFLPQFVNLEKARVPLQIFILGILFVGLATVTDSAYSLISSAVAGRLRTSRLFGGGQRYVTGLVYVGLGVTALLSGSSNK